MFVLVVLLFLSGVVSPVLAHSPTFVCTAGDTGCLIASISKANLQPQRAATIELDASTFTLDRPDHGDLGEGFTGLPLILGKLTLRGQGVAQTILERAQAASFFRILETAPGAVVHLEDFTLQGGALDPVFFYSGGGILNAGDLVVERCVIRSHEAWIGGGIHNTGRLWLIRSAVTENGAVFVAAGITALGPTWVVRSFIGDNVAEEEAGIGFGPQAGKIVIVHSVIGGNIALVNTGGGLGGVGTVEMRDTLLIDNRSGGRGGALNLDDGKIDLRDSAVVGNQTAHFGAGIYVERGTVDLRHSVVTGNRITELFGAGGGIANDAGVVRLRQKSVVTDNAAPEGPDCAGTVTVSKGSVVGNPEGCEVAMR